MEYYRNLYLGEQISKRCQKVREKLNKGETVWNTYLIVLSPNPRNQLEFFDAILLKQDWFAKKDYLVVGMAAGYDEAIEVTWHIVDDIYRQTDSADIRGILEMWHHMESGSKVE